MKESYLENITNFLENTSYLFSNNTNSSEGKYYEFEEELYKYYVPLLILFCFASVVINIRVLLAIHWLRRPISPTLQISLSLAAADAVSSAFLGIGLFINSYIPQVLEVHLPCYISLTVEMYRLSAVIITVVHLLALSMNHWLGIFKPLHYASTMTTKKTSHILVFLWTLPILFFNVYFFSMSKKGFWIYGCQQSDTFIHRLKFRLIFSLLFFIPLVLMILFYTHILLIVKKQQNVRTKLSRPGSKRTKSQTKHSSQQRRIMEGNVKAVCTTLLILGSCLIGWMPAVMRFLLVCIGCVFTPEDAKHIDRSIDFFISWTTHFLLILKTLVNPIIYSTRMIEIKEATRRMNLSISGIFCRVNSRDDNPFESQSYHLSSSGSNRATSLYRLKSNTSQKSIRRNQANTLV